MRTHGRDIHGHRRRADAKLKPVQRHTLARVVDGSASEQAAQRVHVVAGVGDRWDFRQAQLLAERFGWIAAQADTELELARGDLVQGG